MFRIAVKASVHRMACITDRHIPYEGIEEKVDKRRQPKRAHRVHGLASREKVDARCNPNPNDSQTGMPIEIFLDIQGVMTAGYTYCDDTAIDQ